MSSHRYFSAAIRCGSFEELVRQLELLEKALPKRLKMQRFSEVPHDSNGVNYWCAIPATDTRFKKNVIGQCRSQLVFSLDRKASSLFREVVDFVLNAELSEGEEISLDFCSDCTCEVLRTTLAGALTIRPYRTLPNAPDRPQSSAYVPHLTQWIDTFAEEITFSVDYVDGACRDVIVNSREEFWAAFQSSPVVCLRSRPFISWNSFRATFGPAFLNVAQSTDEVFFRFSFTGLVECIERRLDQFSAKLKEGFERTFVFNGFEKGFDPLLGLRDAVQSATTTQRYPLLHKTIVASKSDIEVQIDGLLDTQGTFGLELICNDRRCFENVLKTTDLAWFEGTETLGRWKVLPSAVQPG